MVWFWLVATFLSRETLYVIMKEETAEQQVERIQKYWNEVEEKTNSILEVLKGVSFQQVKSIQQNLDTKIKEKINSSVVL